MMPFLRSTVLSCLFLSLACGGDDDGPAMFDASVTSDGAQCTDSDNDGTCDDADQCPDDPARTEPGSCGCSPEDSDSDGTADCEDGCPDDADKTQAGMCGCGIAETDTDRDDTADCNDGCPQDGNKSAPGICDCGTPDLDGDGDETMDCLDSCPTDAGKTLPGACGCGIADEDNDGDSQIDCGEDCPNDPNKSSPGVCGCGIADIDTDGDGTMNCIDGCPLNPGKIAAGVCGCSVADTNSDGDGAPDCVDNCDNDPNKINAGVCGCGTADTDGDGDGTPNCNDACASDPNKTAPGQCGCGIADGDADGDGTINCQEDCPNDPDKIDEGVCGCGNPENPNFTAGRDEEIFVTAATFTGDLRNGQANAQEGADDICQDAAQAAGLGRDFVAVLGGGSIGSLTDRVQLCGQVRNLNGAVLFDSLQDMVAGGSLPDSTITNQSSTTVASVTAWTGLTSSGAGTASNCANFVSTSSGAQGGVGSFTSNTTGGWLGATTQACSSSARLYCMSQLPPEVEGFSVSPTNGSLGLAQTDTFTIVATALFNYGPRQNVSTSTTWMSSNPSVATVDDGVVTFSQAGTVTITASYQGMDATATVTATNKTHRIFMTEGTWGLSGNNEEFQLDNNAHCQDAADDAGLAGTWLGIYSTGFIRANNGVPYTLTGPVLGLNDEVVIGYPIDFSDFVSAIPTDEDGDALPGGATAWTSECAFNFAENANVASYGSASMLRVDLVACSGNRRRICVSQ